MGSPHGVAAHFLELSDAEVLPILHIPRQVLILLHVLAAETLPVVQQFHPRPDRHEISADGENAVILTVEVQDAQGRVLPITENEVAFKTTGPGHVIGTGNGDPTSHEPDHGSSRKAFAGLCMAILQSTRSAGSVKVEVSSPSLAGATATVTSKAMKFRPQVPVWEREVPTGTGVTGLWRPTTEADAVYTFRQNGDTLTGSVEATGGGGAGPGGGPAGGTIEDGKIDGAGLSFRAGNATYTGTINGDRIELRRTGGGGRGGRGGAPPAETGPRPAIGPPPDGSDPSFGNGGGGRGRGGQAPAPLVLTRATR